MGERANVVVVDEYGPPFYLYTHWDGSELGQIVASALSRKERWDDGPYLARIVFCEMVKKDLHGATGYGISTYPPDNSYPYIVLDVIAQRVLIGEAADEPSTLLERTQGAEPDGFVVIPFAEHANLPAVYAKAHES